MITPYAHQQATVDRFPKRELMAWQVRTGKTLTSILLANKAACPALFIVPKQLFKQWHVELMQHCTVPFELITKEQFRKHAKTLGGRNTVVVDEAHHFSGMHSVLSRYLMAYIRLHSVEHVYLLTGTPYRSTPWNIYRLAQILGVKWDYFKFRNEFFEERHLGRRVVWQPKPNCQDALAAKVREIGSIVRLDECTDMPTDPLPIVETVDPTAEQRVMYEEIRTVESNPLTRFGKLHQAAQGILIGDGYVEDRMVPCQKDAVVLSYLKEYDRGLLFCRYNLQIERYRRLCEQEGIPYIVINGATKDVDEARRQVREMKYGLAIIQSACAEGYDFSMHSLTMYASLSYSYLDFEQSQGRTKHMEKRVPNTYVIINTKGSNDLPVWASIQNKRSFSEAVYAKETQE